MVARDGTNGAVEEEEEGSTRRPANFTVTFQWLLRFGTWKTDCSCELNSDLLAEAANLTPRTFSSFLRSALVILAMRSEIDGALATIAPAPRRGFCKRSHPPSEGDAQSCTKAEGSRSAASLSTSVFRLTFSVTDSWYFPTGMCKVTFTASLIARASFSAMARACFSVVGLMSPSQNSRPPSPASLLVLMMRTPRDAAKRIIKSTRSDVCL